MRESRIKDSKITIEELAKDPKYGDLISDYAIREEDTTEFDRFRRYFVEQLVWLVSEEATEYFSFL